MQVKSMQAQIYSGTYNELRHIPQLQDYLDPEYNPLAFNPDLGGDHVMACLQTLDLMRSVADSAPQNIAEPGMGYVSSLVFRSESGVFGDLGGQLLLERLNDTGVGDNFRISGTLPESAPHYEFVQNLFGTGHELWYWGSKAYTHASVKGGWQQSTPLTNEQAAQLNECLSWVLANAVFEVAFPD